MLLRGKEVTHEDVKKLFAMLNGEYEELLEKLRCEESEKIHTLATLTIPEMHQLMEYTVSVIGTEEEVFQEGITAHLLCAHTSSVRLWRDTHSEESPKLLSLVEQELIRDIREKDLAYDALLERVAYDDMLEVVTKKIVEWKEEETNNE